jgi:hypothetical protein
VGNRRDPNKQPPCPEPPGWQVDGLAGDYAALRIWALSTYRLCVVGKTDPAKTP